MLFVRSLGPAFAVVLAGCAAIPELEFDDDAGDAAALSFTHPEPDDAGMADEDDAPFNRDADPITDESGDASRAEDTSRPPPPPTNDAAPPSVDAAPPSTDASPPSTDASPPSTDASPPPTGCPWTTPAGASACCGIVPCVGKKCATHCQLCIGCLGGVCCLASNGKTAKCAATPSACPHANK